VAAGQAGALPKIKYIMTTETTFKPEVSTTFITEPDDTFSPTVDNIIQGVKGNPLFPNSQTSITDVEGLYDAYKLTLVDPDKRTSETAAARIAAREPLETALRQLLPQVQLESRGDLTRLLSTNIPLVRNPVKPSLPATPNAINLFLFGSPIKLFAQCDSQPNTQVYHARISTDQENWQWANSASTSYVPFSGLPKGVVLYVQMMVKNSVGESDWSGSKQFMIPAEGITIPERKRPKGYK